MQSSPSGTSDFNSGILSKVVNFASSFLSSESPGKTELNTALNRFGSDRFFHYIASNLRPVLADLNNKYLSASDFIGYFNQPTLEERLNKREQLHFTGYNFFTFEDINLADFPFARFVCFKYDSDRFRLEGRDLIVNQLLSLTDLSNRQRIEKETSQLLERLAQLERQEAIRVDEESKSESSFGEALGIDFDAYQLKEDTAYTTVENNNLFDSDFNPHPIQKMSEQAKDNSGSSSFQSLVSQKTPTQSTASFLDPQSFSSPVSGSGFGNISFGNQGFGAQAFATQAQPVQNPIFQTPPVALNPTSVAQFTQNPVLNNPQPGMNMQTLALALQQLMGAGAGGQMTEWGPLNQAPSKPYVEQPKFDELKSAAGTSVRQPKNMQAIFAKFYSFFKSEKVGSDKAWPEAILKGLYVEYVLGAKDKKAQLKAGGKGWQKIPFADESTACVVFIGKPNQGMRTDLSADPPLFTYPDFCACVVIAILYFNAEKKSQAGSATFKSDLPTWSPAPLAANIKNERPEYLEEGYHLCGHSGLPSMINYFWNKKKKNEAWGPLVGNLVELGILMDEQSKGNLGKNATKEQIARTCGAPANLLLADVWTDKWVVMAQTTQAARTAVDLLSAQSAISVQMSGTPNPFSGTNPVKNAGGSTGFPSV